jgi:PAS domain S-box-containing protein
MAKARIMVVEDEQITATDIEDILNGLGYEVTAICSSGPDAIEQAKQTHPDLVLMDIRIKGKMDGAEAAQEIRRRFDIPVVYLTAHADRETLDRAKSAEPLGYIVKPFQEVDLQATIQIALHKHTMDRKTRESAAHLAATLGALTEGVICLDEMGHITYMNAAGEEGTGWKQGAALGRDVAEVFKVINRKDRSPAEGSMMQALRRGRLLSLSEDSVLVRKNDTEHPITGHATPLRDPRGRLSGAVILFGRQVPQTQRMAPGAGGQRLFETGGVEMLAESPATDRARRIHAPARPPAPARKTRRAPRARSAGSWRCR